MRIRFVWYVQAASTRPYCILYQYIIKDVTLTL